MLFLYGQIYSYKVRKTKVVVFALLYCFCMDECKIIKSEELSDYTGITAKTVQKQALHET